MNYVDDSQQTVIVHESLTTISKKHFFISGDEYLCDTETCVHDRRVESNLILGGWNKLLTG